MLIDKGNVLADKLGATVTPEVYFFDEKNVLLYHGAIDNDRSGKNVSENILRVAFDSKLGGKPIPKQNPTPRLLLKRVGGSNFRAGSLFV